MISCAALLSRNAPAAPTVVGLWRFDEGNGSTAQDSSGLGNNGTLTGENGNVPAWVPSQTGFGNALRFTNDLADHSYVSIPGSPVLQVGQSATNPWTMTVWAFEDSNGTNDFPSTYGRMIVTDDGFTFQLESGAPGDGQLYTWSGPINTAWQIGWGAGSAVTPLLDQWEHWAVVYDGTNLTVYLNGNQGPHGGTVSMPVISALGYFGYQGSVLIGSELDETADRTWNGMLDDVAIFAGALSQAQIQTVMSGDFSSFIGGPAAVVSQPQSLTVAPGGAAAFVVGASGQQPVFYQWYFNGTNRLAGETNATLLLPDVQPSLAGTYSVAVTNTAGGQVSAPATLTAATLVGLWRFNEGSGTNVLDSSGLGNNGTLNGENGNLPGFVAGQAGFGSALSFTNDSLNHSYVEIPGNDTLRIGLTPTNAWSVTTWAYESSDNTVTFVSTYGRILTLDDGTALQLESGAGGDDEFYTWARANLQWQVGWGIFPALTPLLDQWEHWAVVYDGNTNLSLYLNGNQGPKGGLATTNVTAALAYLGYTGQVHIGSELGQDGTRNWNGLLDDIAIFNVALSPAQVRQVMAGDFNGFVPAPPLSISLSPTDVMVSWPGSAPTFQLQSATNLVTGAWSAVPASPVQNGLMLTVSLPRSMGPQYFRLVGP